MATLPAPGANERAQIRPQDRAALTLPPARYFSKDVTPLAMVMALAGLANGYLGFLAPVAPGLAGPGPAVMLATVLFSLVALAVGVLLVFGSSIHVAMQQLHDNLLREQYVIGRRLLDRREWQERSGTPARPEAASAS